jgi:hypothetical protein
MKLQSLENFNCVNHSTREGVGICMAPACRKVVCDECSTKLEGVNTCLDCLNKKINKSKKKSGCTGRFMNKITGLLLVIIGFFMVIVTFHSLGLRLPKSRQSITGNRIFKNKAIVDALLNSCHRFNTDCGRYPSQKEAFKALDWDTKTLGQAPKGYAGSYWPYEWELKVKIRFGLPLDAYGRPLRYILHPSLPGPVILSAGADGIFETELQDLIRSYEKWRARNRVPGSRGSRPKPKIIASGDDQIAH